VVHLSGVSLGQTVSTGTRAWSADSFALRVPAIGTSNAATRVLEGLAAFRTLEPEAVADFDGCGFTVDRRGAHGFLPVVRRRDPR